MNFFEEFVRLHDWTNWLSAFVGGLGAALYATVRENIKNRHRFVCELCHLSVKTNSKEALMRVRQQHMHETL